MCFRLFCLLTFLATFFTITSQHQQQKPVLNQFSATVKQREGSRFALHCSATYGQTPIHFTWTKDGQKLASKEDYQITNDELTSMLLVKNVSRRHSGAYRCTASNAHGADSQSSALVVQCWEKLFTQKICLFSTQILTFSLSLLHPNSTTQLDQGALRCESARRRGGHRGVRRRRPSEAFRQVDHPLGTVH